MHYSSESTNFSQDNLFVKVNNKKLPSNNEEMFTRTHRHKHSNKIDSFQVLFNALSYVGVHALEVKPLNLSSRLVRYIYPLLANIFIVDFTITVILSLSYSSRGWQITLAYLILSLLTLALWHIMYRKKPLLARIFIDLKKVSEDFSVSDVPRQIFIKIYVVVNFMLSLIFVCLALYMLYTSEQTNLYCVVLSYNIWQKCERTFPCTMILFLKTTEISFVTPIFSNLVSFMYCCLCYRSSALLVQYKRTVEDIISSKTYYKLDTKLESKYHELKGIIDKIQNAFSLPIMIAFSVSFMQAFVLFARFLLHTERELQLMLMIEHICLHFPSGILTFFTAAFAAQVSTQMKRNQAAFQRIYENETFRPVARISSKNLCVIMNLRDSLPLTLSAGDIIEFSGSIVPSVLGSLLTYGLLVLNVNT